MSGSVEFRGIEFSAPAVAERIQRRSLLVGAVAAVACLIGAVLDWPQFLRSYLVAYVLWVGISLGCLSLLLLQYLSGGFWGLVIRRQLEAASRILPVMALLFVPILFGMPHVYEWAREGAMQDPILKAKEAYLNVPFFIARQVVYFAIVIFYTMMLTRWSERQERDPAYVDRRNWQRVSGPGLVVYSLVVTFMSFDWIMTLAPHWFSTIYGMLFMAGHALSALAFCVAVTVLLARYEPMVAVLRPTFLHDLGKLLFAFVMLWAYLNFSQFLIIWSGNLAEEVPWYVARLGGGWQYVSLGLVIFHFVVPFSLLLSKDVKRHGRTVTIVALGLIFMRLVDIWWNVAPNFVHGEPAMHLHWLDIATPVAVGGIWLWLFFGNLRRLPVLPMNDPRLLEAMAAEHKHGH